jgi:hypothetical protein
MSCRVLTKVSTFSVTVGLPRGLLVSNRTFPCEFPRRPNRSLPSVSSRIFQLFQVEWLTFVAACTRIWATELMSFICASVVNHDITKVMGQ